MSPDKVNLAEKLSQFFEQWTPKVIADLDDYDIKLTKLEGDFVWHAHEDEDEMFLVLDGRMRMDFRDRQEWLEKGEMIVIPKGVEHKPYADEECSVMLIEKKGLINTGDADDARRVDVPDRMMD